MSTSENEDFDREIVDEVRSLCDEGFLTADDIRRILSEDELALIEEGPERGIDLDKVTQERLRTLVELGIFRRSNGGDRPARNRRPKPPLTIIAPQGSAAHEITDLSLLLIAFDPGDRGATRDFLEAAVDTRFAIDEVEGLEEAGEALRSGADVAIIDLATKHGPGMEAMARLEIVSAPIPVIPFIRREEEAQALHLGIRDYLVKGQLDSRLVVKTLRSAVDQQRLREALLTSRERELFHASRDAMTGLPNRLFFKERLRRAVERGERDGKQVSVLFLDVDRFKNINDTLGHAVGDQLIMAVADRLASAVRRTDLVARVGGDEFVLLLQGSEVDYAPANVAGKLLDLIAQPIELEDQSLSVTASIGIAVCPVDGTNPEVLLRNADAALYQAKARGRDTYQFYSQSVNAVAVRRMAVETKLREVVGTKALELYYQPRVDVAQRQIVGGEALLRWVDPELGLVPPSELISVAEESGLIVPLGDWAIREACEQHRRWRDAGFEELRVSVNVSPKQIRRGALRAALQGTLGKTGVDPSLVELELTESVLIDDPDLAAEVLCELKELGITLALDDFGTGFSSLNHLRRFPVDTIKIDQSFVRDIASDGNDAAIIDAMISIGDKLHLSVVAEGVETTEQRDFLLERGCIEMQGYLFGAPMSSGSFSEALKRMYRSG